MRNCILMVAALLFLSSSARTADANNELMAGSLELAVVSTVDDIFLECATANRRFILQFLDAGKVDEAIALFETLAHLESSEAFGDELSSIGFLAVQRLCERGAGWEALHVVDLLYTLPTTAFNERVRHEARERVKQAGVAHSADGHGLLFKTF